jgi:hypothetical protein
VRLGKPEQEENIQYSKLNIDGVAVYAHNSVETIDKSLRLEIVLEGMLGNEHLVMYGMPIN